MKKQVKPFSMILGIVFCLMLLNNQVFSAPTLDKRIDNREGTEVTKPQVDKPGIQRELTTIPGTPPTTIPQNEGERGKTKMGEPAPQSTASQPVEEEKGGLLSGIWEFLKILLVVVIALGAGYLFYWIYRKIKKIDEYINTLRKAIKEEEISQQTITLWQGTDHLRRYPIGGTREESYPPQEISRINQKIEAIERRFNIYSDEHKKILEESRRQNRLYSLLQELFRKETSARESILQEMSKIQKGSTPSYEEPEIRKEEPQKPTSQIKKPLTEQPEQHLIEWWNEFGNQLLSKCKETLTEKFFNVTLEVILARSEYNNENWQVVGVRDNIQTEYFILPRKESQWWSDYPKQLSDYDPWFDIEEKTGPNLWIKSLKSPLPKAIKDPSGQWKLISPKGKVSIKESQ